MPRSSLGFPNPTSLNECTPQQPRAIMQFFSYLPELNRCMFYCSRHKIYIFKVLAKKKKKKNVKIIHECQFFSGQYLIAQIISKKLECYSKIYIKLQISDISINLLQCLKKLTTYLSSFQDKTLSRFDFSNQFLQISDIPTISISLIK